MSIKELSDQKLDRLSNDPNNIVYKYEDRKPLPVDEIVPLHKVKELIIELWDETQMVRKSKLKCPIGKDMSLLQCKKLRWWLVTKSPKKVQWQKFSMTHPSMFDCCTGQRTTQKEITAMMYIIYLKERCAKDSSIDGKKYLQEYLWKTFSRPLEKK